MKRFSVTVNGKAYDVSVEEITGGESVPAAVVSVPPAAAASVTVPVSAAAPEGSISVKAPMPGTILDIKVNAGDEVKDLVKNYGMVIVDECHHVSAVSFEGANCVM